MNAVAVCSCPRLGYMDFMGHSIAAFAQNQINYKNAYEVYWHQSLTKAIQDSIDEGYEYIITCDYDSIFTRETVAQLVRLIEQNEHADAICTMQMGRFSGLLMSTESGTVTRKELKENALVPAKTGHFGLTIFRASSLKKAWKPWFKGTPDINQEWSDKNTKVDEDTYFWNSWAYSGLTLFVAPRLVIGHLELLIKWPDENLDGIYETSQHYQEFGQPADVWK